MSRHGIGTGSLIPCKWVPRFLRVNPFLHAKTHVAHIFRKKVIIENANQCYN